MEIKVVSTKKPGRVVIKDENGQWYTAWEKIKVDGKTVPNPAIPFLKKGFKFEPVIVENGDFKNIVGIVETELPNEPPSKEDSMVTQEMWADKERRQIRQKIAVSVFMTIYNKDGRTNAETIQYMTDFLTDLTYETLPMEAHEHSRRFGEPPETKTVKADSIPF